MSWSLQVMNGLETVFRTFDFAKYVRDEMGHAAEGRGLELFHYSTTYKGEVAPLPRWWLMGAVGRDDTLVGNNGGRTKVAKAREQLGRDPQVRMGLVYTCFWLDRNTDREPVVLPPQIVAGAGEVTFLEWGTSQDYAGGYLWELGDVVNQARRTWDTAPVPDQPTHHIALGDDFEWLSPLSLEALDNAELIRKHALEIADHIAGIVNP